MNSPDEELEMRANHYAEFDDDQFCRNCGHDYFDHLVDPKQAILHCAAPVLLGTEVEFCDCSVFEPVSLEDVLESEHPEEI